MFIEGACCQYILLLIAVIFSCFGFFFLMWTIFKVSIECVTTLLVFHILFFFWHVGFYVPDQELSCLFWKAKS